MTFVHDEHWCVSDTCTGHNCGTVDCTSNYSITFAKEFRYDAGSARYLVRDLDPNDFNIVLSETWSDYDGDALYDDFDPGSGSTMGSYQPGMWQSIGGSDDYLHGDMIGTLRMTTIGSGPSAGTPGLPRVFTAFGEKITGPQDRNGFAGAWGYQTHTEFDFQHVGARYYDPSSGRFLQRDPIGLRGGLNVYGYVGNAPTADIDTLGLAPLGGLGGVHEEDAYKSGCWVAKAAGCNVCRELDIDMSNVSMCPECEEFMDDLNNDIDGWLQNKWDTWIEEPWDGLIDGFLEAVDWLKDPFGFG